MILDIQRKLNQARARAFDIVNNDRAMQGLLQVKYYFQQIHHRDNVPGSWMFIQEDGKFGNETENAVRCLQKFLFITENGIMGDWTYQHLMKLLSVKIENPSMLRGDSIAPFDFSVVASDIANVFHHPLYNFGVNLSQQIEEISRFYAEEATLAERFREAPLNRRCIELTDDVLNNHPGLRQLQEEARNLFNAQDNIRDYLANLANRRQYYKPKKNGKFSTKDTIEMLQSNEARRLLGRGSLAEINATPGGRRACQNFQNLLDRYLQRMQSRNFLSRIEKAINNCPIESLRRVRLRGVLGGLAFIPLIIDCFIFVFMASTGKPTEKIVDRIFQDICDLIEGVIIAALIGFIVAAIGLTGGAAMVVFAVIGVIIAFLFMIFYWHPLYHLLLQALHMIPIDF